MIYGLGFILALVSLTLWFRYENQPVGRLLQRLLWLGLLLFTGGWFFSEGAWIYKFSVLLRDSLLLALIPMLLNALRLRDAAFVLALLPIGVGVSVYYFSVLRFTFPQHPEAGVDWELLVELRPGADTDALRELVHRYHLTLEPAFRMDHPETTELDDFYALDIPEHLKPQLPEIEDALLATGLVEYLEDNETVHTARFATNDPYLVQQWGFARTEMARVHELLRGVRPEREILIAILDTGVDGAHEDLRTNFTSTQRRYDTDKQGHGTHCAGVAAAVSNNGLGVASPAPTPDFVEVTSIKVLSDFGIGTQRGIINGILEAADAGAQVISMSLGGRSTPTKQRAYESAVQYAAERGAIVVAAAGNNNGPARQIAPANVRGVITVTALDTLSRRAGFSNTIEGIRMPVAAPGVNILSTTPGNGYQAMSGTSMATPLVSGIVGLMKSLRPELTAEEVHQILLETGEPLEQVRETGRLIRPAAAVGAVLD